MPRANTTPIQIHLPPGVATNLAVAVVAFGVVGVGAVVGTALWGSEEKSERAFRLINKMKKAPESEKTESSPTARSRTRPTARGESSQVASANEIKR
jgi:Flp pilus assembly protein TadB